MFDLITFGAEKIQLFMLILMRVGGIMVAGPLFTHRSVPRKISLAMTLGFAIVILPLFVNVPLPQTSSFIEILALCLKEILVGAIIGIVFNFVFVAVRLAGSIVSYQIGFAMANVMDPNASEPVSVLGEFWMMMAFLIFLAINGHHIMISGLVDSFKIVPLGAATPSAAVGDWIIKYSAFAFVLAVKFASPVIMTIFLVEVAMGVLARTMPQMNIFIVGYPLKIFSGIFLLGISLPVFGYLLQKVTEHLDTELSLLMRIYNVHGAS